MQDGDVPTMMRGVAVDGKGGPDSLIVAERRVDEPGEGEVLIRTAFAGVNRPDIMQREGKYPPPPGASDLPGLEVSGTVIAVGAGVESPVLGQRVCALVPGGGYAEYCRADHRHCLPVPDGMPLAEAAAMPETLFTVWHNIFQRGYARDGETVLIHGGTGGIGTMATTLCRLFSISAITTNGSDDKCRASLAAGAAHAINYREEDFVEQAKHFTGGRGVNVILDTVGGDYMPRNMNALADEGRCVSIAVQRGRTAEIDIFKMMARRLTLTGSTLRARDANFKALLAQEIESYCWPLAESGELRPVMDRVFPLADAASAHAHMESGRHIGKIVLEIAGG